MPAEHQAQAWNIAGAIVRSVLLLALVRRVRATAVVLVSVWWLMEEAMVAGCSLAYIIRPWEIASGQAQCSAMLGFDLGRVTVLFVAALTLFIVRRNYKGL